MGKESPAGLAGKGRKSGLSEEGEGGGMNPSMGALATLSGRAPRGRFAHKPCMFFKAMGWACLTVMYGFIEGYAGYKSRTIQ